MSYGSRQRSTDEDGLTDKERAFVNAYLAEPRLGPAAEAAGYKGNPDTLLRNSHP